MEAYMYVKNIKKKSVSLHTLAIAALLVVAFGYSLLSVGARLLNEEFPPMTGLYLRLGLATLAASIMFRKQLRIKKLKSIPKKDWLPLFFMGFIGYTVSVYFITVSVLKTTLLNYTVVFATLPLFAFLFSLIFLKSKPKWNIMPFVILSLYGVSVVASKSFIPSLGEFGEGELFALMGAATGAFYAVGRKMLSDHLNNQEITVTVMGIAFITSLGIALSLGQRIDMTSFANSAIWIGLTIGTIFNIVSASFENFAFNHLDATFGTQLLLLDNVFAALLGYFLYMELFTPIEALGGAIIVGSVYLTNKRLSDA